MKCRWLWINMTLAFANYVDIGSDRCSKPTQGATYVRNNAKNNLIIQNFCQFGR